MSEQVALSDLSVVIGMPVNRPIPVQTVQSLVGTAHACAKAGIPFELVTPACTVLQVGRDMVVDYFLRSGANRLFWVDSDIAWNTPDFFKMLALSKRVDVVTAAYPTKVEGRPVFATKMIGNSIQTDGPYGLAEIEGIGLGFALMTRDVVDAVAKTKPVLREALGNRDLAQVFRFDVVDGTLRTEDIAFFADIREAGFKVWLDPTIPLGHIGERMWHGAMIDAFKPVKERE